MLHHALEAISASGVADTVVLVVPAPTRSTFESLVRDLPRVSRIEDLVSGGETRQESVRLGLDAVPRSTDVVLCHDAARPLATPGLFRRVVEGLGGVDGCVPVVPSADTVKLVEAGRVVRTVPRAQVGLAQTPQAFALPALLDAHARALRVGEDATDDAMLVEAAGYTVAAIGGEMNNFKITILEDLLRAEQVLAGRVGLEEGVAP
jgi:2-C-methyl-D-erythritol 4-phosphate cytidylyltransferase / 2-C-methyl-D-erythritol 2,4-cyclodiphosphate synthase